jgi:hypothetical protein
MYLRRYDPRGSRSYDATCLERGGALRKVLFGIGLYCMYCVYGRWKRADVATEHMRRGSNGDAVCATYRSKGGSGITVWRKEESELVQVRVT